MANPHNIAPVSRSGPPRSDGAEREEAVTSSKPADVSPASVGAPFTPAPWEVVASQHPDNGNRWLEIVESASGSIIGEIYNDEAEAEPFVTHEIAEANARLIAAAPEMYEALDRLCAAMDELDVMGLHDEWKAALDALAKAQGKSA